MVFVKNAKLKRGLVDIQAGGVSSGKPVNAVIRLMHPVACLKSRVANILDPAIRRTDKISKNQLKAGPKQPFVVAFAFASMQPAHADGIRSCEAENIDLGEVTGIAYYKVEQDRFHVVTTLAQGETGTPIRLVSVLERDQSVTLSTPLLAGPI